LRWYPAILTDVQFAVTSAPLGYGPTDVAFDGANIWVTNTGSNTVSELSASDGSNVGTFNTGTFPTAIAFDGANIGVVNNGSNSVSKF
jgi:DNA-binding beta-propeller fold protein YncE